MLDRTVGVEKVPGQVGHHLALPGHDHPGALGDGGHRVGLQVLLGGGSHKGLRVPGGHDHRHALLGLGDGQLGTVQAVVLLAHRIQVNGQPVGQLADGHAHTAGAKVIAALDQPGHLPVPEQALELALLGGVALLHLAGHGVQAGLVVALGGAGGPADPVPAGTAAQQDDHIPRLGGGAVHMAGRGRTHHRAALQALGDIARVVELGHMAGGQANLVAIGGVARRGSLGQPALGQLALQGGAQGDARIAAPSDPHGLVDVDAAGQGVADTAADTGGRPAEGLNLGGMVVGLIFEHEQPVLLPAVHLGVNPDGAGVDLLTLVQLGQLAPLFQGFGPNGSQIHQGLGPLGRLLRPVYLLAGGQVAPIGGPDLGVLDVHPVQVGGEGGVPAVIRPVGIHQPQLGEGGIPSLLLIHILLEKFQIGQIHGQAILGQHPLQARLVHVGKAQEHGDRPGGGVALDQGVRLVHGGLAALHRVNQEVADFLHRRLVQAAGEQVDRGRLDHRAIPARHELHTLGGRIGPLVVLPGQGLHRQHLTVDGRAGEVLVIELVHLGLGKHRGPGGLIGGLVHPLNIIPVEYPDTLEAGDPQGMTQLIQKASGLYVKARFFLRVAAIYLSHFKTSMHLAGAVLFSGYYYITFLRPAAIPGRQNLASVRHWDGSLLTILH